MSDEQKPSEAPTPPQGTPNSAIVTLVRTILDEAQAVDPTTHKPGYKTSEFWLHVAGHVLAGFLGYYGAVHDSTACVVVAGVMGVTNQAAYTFARTLAKKPPRRVT